MKLVFYTDQMYLHGGIEKMLSIKLNYFSSLENYEVHLILFEQNNQDFCYDISSKVIVHNLDINYNRNISYFKLENLKKLPTHISKLKRKLSEIKPDIMIVANYSYDFYFIPFIKKEIKVIKEYHSSRFKNTLPKKSLKKRMFNNLIEYINSKYDSVVVLNGDEKKLYTTSNIDVIPNCIPSNNIEKKIIRKNRIISAGRIAPVKQFDHLIKAWSRIELKYPDWYVEIYGDGDIELTNKLRELIIKNNLRNIKFVGSTSKLDDIMLSSSIFVLCSETECFPMVLLECLKNSLPIVSYRSPFGPQNIITENKDGILVEHNNIEQLSEKLELLIINNEIRMDYELFSNKSFEKFSTNIVMKKWIGLFRELTKKGNK